MYYSYILHKIKGNLIILPIKLHITFKRVMYYSYLLLKILATYYVIYVLQATLKE